MTRGRLGSLLLVCAGTLGVATLTSTPSDADPATTVRADDEPGSLVLLLDASGSMQEPAAGGTTKIQAARDALTQVIDLLPDDAQVGMRVLGATVFSKDEPGACTDTQNVVPVGPVDRDALGAAITAYEPFGETPIGNALKAAADDLGPDGTRTIVLLSDGEPTCPPDPCLVARQLHRRGVDLTINVVGLDVSGKAQEILQCIADAGGGTYYDVDDPDELSTSLVSTAVRAFRRFSLSGTPVDGGQTPEDAPEIEPGQYTDHVGPGEEGRVYTVVKEPGSGLSVGVTARPESGGDIYDKLDVGIGTEDGAVCARSYDLRANVLAERPIVSSGASYVPEVTAGADDECLDADRLVVAVAFKPSQVDKPFEMEVTEQPGVVNLTELPPPVTDDDPYVRRARARGPARVVVGGAGYAEAPELGPGVYADTLRPGEQLLYRFPVDWGQALRVTFTVAPDPLASAQLDRVGDTVQVGLVNPVRQLLSPTVEGDRGVRYTDLYNGDTPAVLTAATVPVRLTNATVNDFKVADTHLAGDYVASIEMGRLQDARRFAVPVRIQAQLVGEPEGEPELATGEPSESPTATPSAASPSEGTTGTTDPSSGDGDDGVPVPPLVVLGIVVLAAVGGAAFRFGRRRAAATRR